jgi:uncharacterized membrane protein
MKRIRLIGLISGLAVFHLLGVSGTLQSANPSAKKKAGQVAGTILDINDARVVRARVKVLGQGFKWQGETDTNGEFTVEVPFGEYRVYIIAAGFRKFESASFKVKSGAKQRVNLQLEEARAQVLIPAENEKKP